MNVEKKNRTFAEIFEKEKWIVGLPAGAQAKSAVIAVDENHVVFNAGLKSEAFISKKELGDTSVIKEGDWINLYVVSPGGQGKSVLSYERAVIATELENLQTAFQEKKVIQGEIIGKKKNNFIVKLGKLQGFLPITAQVDSTELKTGDIIPVRITRLDASKPLIYLTGVRVDESTANTLMDAVVIDIKDTEAIVTVEDKEYSVQIPTNFSCIPGSTIKVKIKPSGVEIYIPEPPMEIKENDIIKAHVVAVNEYGAFLRIGRNADGFLHISEVSWSEEDRVLPRVGADIEALVISVDRTKSKPNANVSIKRINNIFKQFCELVHDLTPEKLSKNPDVTNITIAPDGSIIIESKVVYISPKGFVAVRIYKELDGFITSKELAWEPHQMKELIKDMESKKETGYYVKAKLLDINEEREKVYLSIKQLQKDPIKLILEKYPLQTLITGKVSSINSQELIIDTDDHPGIAVIKKSGFSKNITMSNKMKGYNINDVVTAKVVGIDYKRNMLITSIKEYELECDKKALKEHGSTEDTRDVFGEYKK